MVGPLVLVHPAEQHEEQVHQRLLFNGELLEIQFVVLDDIVAEVDDLGGLLALPVVLLVLAPDCEAQVVQEAGQQLLLLARPAHYAQEVTPHVLARLRPLAELVGLVVVYRPVQHRLLELLHAVVVDDRVLLFIVLS
jgi:hypothetical protein